jgi:hypothetical protein
MARLAALLFLLPALHADDGIWLFNEIPRDLIQKKYNFTITDDFLRKLQISSVRFNNGGSGSFVSPDGLVFTNHHVGSDCIQKLSTQQADYMKNGFHALTRDKEAKCPDLELNVLLRIENVTERVKAAGANQDLAQAAKPRRATMSAVEKECSDKTGHRCEVVTLFSGGQYHLYEYQKYTDIRLVFAPEKAIAFFGGDPDNFVYPRYNLDIAFFRVYENNAPAKPREYLRWSKAGIQKNDLTFVSGHPGSTGRLQTLAELEFSRDLGLPLNLDRIDNLITTLQTYAKRGPEQARIADEETLGNQNSQKAFRGFLGGLRDPKFLAEKAKQEQSLRNRIQGNPDLSQKYSTAWTELATMMNTLREIAVPLSVFENNPTRSSMLMEIGRTVYRYANEKAKPDAERLREFASAGLPSLEESLYSPAPIHPEMEEVVIADYLRFAQRQLGPNHPVLQALLNGQTPEQAAHLAVATTKLANIDERRRLANDPQAANTSEDGILKLVRAIDPEARRYRKLFEDKIQAKQAIETARIAQAQYALGGSVYPDATFTLRLSYGPALGYRDASSRNIPWMTDFNGLYTRAKAKGNRDPWELPQRWLDKHKLLATKTPFNYVTTADTHGGNSGSPTINKAGEVVGILFDGNLEGLPNRYLYTDTSARSVHVASQGILEALRKVYGADLLLKELGF